MNWFWTRRREAAEEIEAHIEERAGDLVESGVPRQEALQQARREFGNTILLTESTREIWGWLWLDRLGQDIRYALRMMRRSPAFTAVAVLSLALGIGANTAIYSVMDAVLIRSLPVRNPGELVILHWRGNQAPPPGVKDIDGEAIREPGGGWASPDFPWPFYALLRNKSDVFSAVLAYKHDAQLNLFVRGQAEVGPVEFVSGSFFSGLGIVPAAGRLVDDSDNLIGAPPVAVLSHSYWRGRFGGDPAALGQTVNINNVPFTIAGVAAPEFFGVVPGAEPVFYIPIVTRPALNRTTAQESDSMFVTSEHYWVDIVGRLRPGVTMARAQAELAARFHQFTRIGSDNKNADLPSLWLEEGGSGVDALRRQYAKPLLVLMTMVAFILAIACANVAGLLLAWATSRRREMAVRLGLGATRARVLRQLLTESVLLALPGGLLGLAVASAGIPFLLWLIAGGRENFRPRPELDWRVLAFTMAVTFATGIFFGFTPSLEATRVDLTSALKQARAGASRGRGRRVGLSRLLVVAQIALSMLLVLGAALFVRTLANLHSVELGFNAGNVLTFNLNGSKAGHKGAALTAFYARMEEHLSVLPGIRAVTVTNAPLAGGSSFRTPIIFPGKQAGGGHWCSVGPTFFESMQIPILLGRAIDSRDVENAPLAVVVNQALAEKYFPSRNPVGAHITILDGTDVMIVGVAKDARDSLKQPIPPFVYIAYRQNLGVAAWRGMFFELRTAGDPLALAQTVRKAIHEAAPNVPIANIVTQSERIDNSIAQERTFANLGAAFAILALAIACVGLYGSMAYAVSRRTNEIGIRMALGAERRGIVWMVLREVLALAAAGLAVGLVCAWAAMPAIESFLFGVKPADPLAILLAAGILIAALVLAGYAPARRASRIDPLSALRHD